MNKLIGGIIGAGVIAAATGAAVVYKVISDKKKQKELDEFLMGDEETAVVDVPEKEEAEKEEAEKEEEKAEEPVEEEKTDIEVEFKED